VIREKCCRRSCSPGHFSRRPASEQERAAETYAPEARDNSCGVQIGRNAERRRLCRPREGLRPFYQCSLPRPASGCTAAVSAAGELRDAQPHGEPRDDAMGGIPMHRCLFPMSRVDGTLILLPCLLSVLRGDVVHGGAGTSYRVLTLRAACLSPTSQFHSTLSVATPSRTLPSSPTGSTPQSIVRAMSRTFTLLFAFFPLKRGTRSPSRPLVLGPAFRGGATIAQMPYGAAGRSVPVRRGAPALAYYRDHRRRIIGASTAVCSWPRMRECVWLLCESWSHPPASVDPQLGLCAARWGRLSAHCR